MYSNSNYLNDLYVDWAREEEEAEYNAWMTEEMYNEEEEEENEEDN
jgi:hypothetical protein